MPNSDSVFRRWRLWLPWLNLYFERSRNKLFLGPKYSSKLRHFSSLQHHFESLSTRQQHRDSIKHDSIYIRNSSKWIHNKLFWTSRSCRHVWSLDRIHCRWNRDNKWSDWIGITYSDNCDWPMWSTFFAHTEPWCYLRIHRYRPVTIWNYHRLYYWSYFLLRELLMRSHRHGSWGHRDFWLWFTANWIPDRWFGHIRLLLIELLHQHLRVSQFECRPITDWAHIRKPMHHRFALQLHSTRLWYWGDLQNIVWWTYANRFLFPL